MTKNSFPKHDPEKPWMYYSQQNDFYSDGSRFQCFLFLNEHFIGWVEHTELCNITNGLSSIFLFFSFSLRCNTEHSKESVRESFRWAEVAVILILLFDFNKYLQPHTAICAFTPVCNSADLPALHLWAAQTSKYPNSLCLIEEFNPVIRTHWSSRWSELPCCNVLLLLLVTDLFLHQATNF